MKTSVTQQEIVDLMNELLEKDKEAIETLINYHVPCNEAIQNHPTVQVRKHNEQMQVGLLGILNGFFGCDENGYGSICTYVEDDDHSKIEKFAVLEKSNV